nr:hypothetical protein [Tanacetum cinerariifolium]
MRLSMRRWMTVWKGLPLMLLAKMQSRTEVPRSHGDDAAQTRSERVSKVTNDPLLIGVNTPQSREDSLKLTELMELCTNLQQRVLNLVLQRPLKL